MTQIVVASHNAGKVREIEALLSPRGYAVFSAQALGLPEPDETGATFEENAALKAQAAADGARRFALADDSGLCVPALGDAPGLYSARWAGPNKDFTAAMARIAREIEGKGQQAHGARAYFVCVLALAAPDTPVRTVRGEVHGTLSFPPRGGRGFGYDPLFIPEGHTQTFGEMEPALKHDISHRARAFAQLLPLLPPLSAAEAI